MKKLFFIIIVSFSLFTSYSFAQNWVWAKSAGGPGDDKANSIAVDALGNTYIVGYFVSPTITFGNITLTKDTTTINNYYNLFIAKYDVNGNVLWAKNAKKSSDKATSIVLDKLGNLYITGTFEGSIIIFDNDTLINFNNNVDIFIVKYDTDGNVQWAKSFGGESDDFVASLAIDKIGNIYLAGSFSSPIISFDTTTLINAQANNTDIFLTKFNSYGNVIWAKRGGGGGLQDASSVAVDINGNACVCGRFWSSTITFDTITIFNAGQVDLFLVKYDDNGNVLWLKTARGLLQDIATSVAMDTSGNIYLTGYFGSTFVIFDTDTLYKIGGNDDIFLTKYNANGNVLWAKCAGGGSGDCVNSVTIDKSENIYITGSFGSTNFTFDTIVLNKNTGCIFIAKYDTIGNVIWAKNAGGIYGDGATSIVVDTTEAIYITGAYSSPISIFGNITLTTNIGTPNIFIAKLSFDTISGINELYNSISTSIYPNPTSNYLTIETLEKAEIKLLNLQGQQIKRINTNARKTIVNVSSLSLGIYFVEIKTEKGITVKKFIKE